jgi:hypothetical protein
MASPKNLTAAQSYKHWRGAVLQVHPGLDAAGFLIISAQEQRGNLSLSYYNGRLKSGNCLFTLSVIGEGDGTYKREKVATALESLQAHLELVRSGSLS